jgi:hypothetical protein
MLREGRTLRVVLRGTKGRKDLMSDLRAWPEFVPGLGKVHPGFHAGAVAMVPEIRRRSQPGDYLILGGHSKGGADAAQISGILINLGASKRVRPVRPRIGRDPSTSSIRERVGRGYVAPVPGLGMAPPVPGEADRVVVAPVRESSD